MEMGIVMPGHHEGEAVRMWRVPVAVYLLPSAKPLKVTSVYEDEGVLCIDVEEYGTETND
jgi:hypothetical protein